MVEAAEEPDNAASCSGKQQRRLHRHVAATANRGRADPLTPGDEVAEAAADAAGRSCKHQRRLHSHVAATTDIGQRGMNTSSDDLEVKVNPGNYSGRCDPEVTSNGKGDPKGRGRL